VFIMGFFWLGLIVVAVLAAGALFPRGTGQAAGGSNASDPLAIIAERYARGELTREEYQLIRQDLGR